MDRSKKIFSCSRRLVDGDRDRGGYRSVVRIRSIEGSAFLFGRRWVRFIAVKGDRRSCVHRDKGQLGSVSIGLFLDGSKQG